MSFRIFVPSTLPSLVQYSIPSFGLRTANMKLFPTLVPSEATEWPLGTENPV